jgi:hypothetical protein
MKPQYPIYIPLIGLLMVSGCALTSGPHLDTGCPQGQVRVEDEHTGEYDCASQEDYEDLMEAIDEHSRRD